MTRLNEPRFPLYIPSKGRAETARTPRALRRIGVPFTIVVERQEYDEYADYFEPSELLVLDPQYQRGYETLDDLGDSKSKGPGPARNFIWDHSISRGFDWHWVMDDNIIDFYRLNENQRIPFGDGTPFHAMESFVLRYVNIGMAGPQYVMFAPSRTALPPFVINTRIYSCNLIRNDLPFRWRGRYNEDTDLSLVMLKNGWATVQFNAFLQFKMNTQKLAGGNTDAFYASEGTLPKSLMLARTHPDVARVVWRFHRWHHHVDYSPFKSMGLIRRPDYDEIVAAESYPLVTKRAKRSTKVRTW